MARGTFYNDAGLTVAVTCRDEDHLCANTNTEAMESPNASNIKYYDIETTDTLSTGEYSYTIPSWLPAGKRYIFLAMIRASTDLAVSDYATKFSSNSGYWDGVSFTPDYAIKLAQSASPLSNSPEKNIKDSLAVVDGIATKSPDYKPIVNSSGKTVATIAAGDIATDAIDGASIKADAVEKVQTGLATSTNQNAAKAVIDETATNVAETLAVVGVTGAVVGLSSIAAIAAAVWNVLTASLTTSSSIGKWILDKLDVAVSAARASFVVSPVSISVSPGEASAHATLKAYQYAVLNYDLTIRDTTGTARNLSGKSLRMQFYSKNSPDDELFAIATGGTAGNQLVVGGTSHNVVSVEGPVTITATARQMQWRLFNVTDSRIEGEGLIEVKAGPAIDSE